MNLIEVYVKNIIYHKEVDGLHFIIADFDCYGVKKIKQEKYLTTSEWNSVKEKGYYLS